MVTSEVSLSRGGAVDYELVGAMVGHGRIIPKRKSKVKRKIGGGGGNRTLVLTRSHVAG